MVVILCDCIRHYTDNFFSDNWMVEKGVYPWEHLNEEGHLLHHLKIKDLNLREVP